MSECKEYIVGDAYGQWYVNTDYPEYLIGWGENDFPNFCGAYVMENITVMVRKDHKQYHVKSYKIPSGFNKLKRMMKDLLIYQSRRTKGMIVMGDATDYSSRYNTDGVEELGGLEWSVSNRWLKDNPIKADILDNCRNSLIVRDDLWDDGVQTTSVTPFLIIPSNVPGMKVTKIKSKTASDHGHEVGIIVVSPE